MPLSGLLARRMSAQEGDAPKSEAPKPPVPRRTAPERKRKPPAALLDNDSEGSSPPALALNGSPRPGAKRKRSALVPKRPRASQHVTDGEPSPSSGTVPQVTLWYL